MAETMKKRILLGIVAMIGCGPAPALGVEAHRLAAGERITVDGSLDEPAWSRAPLLDRFWQIAPEDNVEARVRTEVRFAYDGRSLFVAVRAHDPDMGEARAPFARRDNVLRDQDMIRVGRTLILYRSPTGLSSDNTIEATDDARLAAGISPGRKRVLLSLCRPYKDGSDETCVVELAQPAAIHVMVRGYSETSTFDLIGRKI